MAKSQQNKNHDDIQGSEKFENMASRPIDFIRNPCLGVNRPMVFLAHRGASHRAPENTIAAFLEANQLFRSAVTKAGGPIYQGYEFDILPTRADATGKPKIVVHHDEKIGRTSQGPLSRHKKIPLVSELSLEELKQLNAGLWKNSAFKNEKIPTLDEVINVALDDTFLDIEVKRKATTESSDGFEEVVLDQIESLNLRGRCLVHSFDWGFMDRFKALAAERSLRQFYPIGLCFEAKDKSERAYWSAKVEPEVIVLQKHPGMAKEIEAIHTEGRKVLVWTVNTTKDISACAKAQADGVISNRPELLSDPEFPAALLQRFRV